MRMHWFALAAGLLLSAPAAAATAAAEPLAPGDDVIGTVKIHSAAWRDTLMDIARAYNLGYVELVAANRHIDPWVPGKGTRVVLPTAHILPDAPRKGIVINLPEMRLYYFSRQGVLSYPVGIGQDAYATPLGQTRVVRKQPDPTWRPTASIRADRPELPAAVPPGPDNPLGTHAVYLGWPAYLIHGTNKPDGVGRRVSRGCIRMYPEAIVDLYPRVGPGTPVRVVNQPVKAGWHDGQLYLEVNPTLHQVDQIEIDGTMPPAPLPDVYGIVRAAAGAEFDRVDWPTVQRVAAERTGMPIRITRDGPMAMTPAPLLHGASLR